MAAIISENCIEVYGNICLWLYVFNSLKYAYSMPRTSRNCSAKFGFTIQFLWYGILKRMIIIYYFEMCPNTLAHMLNEI